MSRILSLAGGLAGATALAVIVATPAANADQTLSGSAFAVKANLSVAETELVNIDPMPSVTYPDGGEESTLTLDSREATKELTDQSNGVIIAKVLNAASNADGGALKSEASVVDLVIGLQTIDALADVQGAALLQAKLIVAECKTGPDGVTGVSKLVDLTVAGYGKVGDETQEGAQNVTVEVPVNTEIPVDGVGKVVLNEQIETDKGLTVNAIHVYVDPGLGVASGDIIVSQATCSDGKGGNDGGDPDPSGSQSTSPPASDGPGDPGSTGPGESDAPGGGGSADDGDLPVTGGKLALVAGLGASLLAAGGGAIWFTRRRREEDAEPEVS